MSKGRLGIHGGQYIPETLMNAVIELENHVSFSFCETYSTLSKDKAGPCPLICRQHQKMKIFYKPTEILAGIMGRARRKTA